MCVIHRSRTYSMMRQRWLPNFLGHTPFHAGVYIRRNMFQFVSKFEPTVDAQALKSLELSVAVNKYSDSCRRKPGGGDELACGLGRELSPDFLDRLTGVGLIEWMTGEATQYVWLLL